MSHEHIEDYLRILDTLHKQRLAALGKKARVQSSPAGFVLEHGRPMTLKKDSKHKRGQMGKCFKNAVEFATSGRMVRYCEGFAMGVIPTLHAWCIDREGRVLDPTWPYPDASYWGVPFKIEYVLRRVVESESYVSMLDDWMGDWPLLTGKHALADAVAS